MRQNEKIACIFLSLLFIFAIANDVPVLAEPGTFVLDFESLPTGIFTVHQEDGFRIHYIGFGDKQTISDVAGNHVLKDSAYNLYGAECYINSLDGNNFYFHSLDYNNFNNNYGYYRIDVRVFPYPFNWGTAKLIQLNPTSSTFSTLTAAALGVDGIELCQMRVNLVSGNTDYSVDNITLSPATTVAIVDVDPDTLNLSSKGVFTTYITLDGYDVSDVDISTIACDGASAIRGVVEDDVLIAKFNRQDLIGVEAGEEVVLTVTGNLLDGRPFSGSHTIRVIDKGKN